MGEGKRQYKDEKVEYSQEQEKHRMILIEEREIA
jgi:hypothetical protein